MVFDPGPTEPTALALCNFAGTYLTACEEVAGLNHGEQTQQTLNLLSPMFYLASHTLELTLKSFLMLKGYNCGSLKKYGHDLNRISDECHKFGFSIKHDPDYQQVKELVLYFDDFNKTHKMRYLFLGLTKIPDPAHCLEILRVFHAHVREIILFESDKKAAV